MGIPFFYRQIIAKDQKKLLCEVGGCDQLFLDFNSIIHTCAAGVVSKNKDALNIEELIFENIFEHTMMLTKICKPKQLLYIAIDGVAPRGKMHQQRKRRYLSAYRNDIINKFKDINNIKYMKWDSNAITPGTEFMKKLHSYLELKIIESVDLGYEIILSGCDENGEGEQKIFDYMKKKNDPSRSMTHVIYGLDADLIMLSLCSGVENVYLMREGQNFFNGMTDFKYLDINSLKTSVSKYLYNDEEIGYMYDYVFICFFLGNDFLPNISSFKIKAGAIDIICAVYKKVYAILQKNLIIKKTLFSINNEFLILLLEKLSEQEDALMKETSKQFYTDYTHKQPFTSGKVERFTQELDNYPTLNKFPKVINPETDSSWRANYYHHLFGNHANDIIKSASANYIEGMVWTINYYFNNKCDTKWYYKYNYAPCISDIYKYLKTESNALKTIDKAMKNDVFVDPSVQLLMVLPSSSKNLLDPALQKIMEEISLGCVHYYPIKFCLTSYLKSQLWECLPVLPNIDINNIQKAYKKVQENESTI